MNLIQNERATASGGLRSFSDECRNIWGRRCPRELRFSLVNEPCSETRQKVVLMKRRATLPRFYFGAVSVLELTAGTLTATDTRVGDGIEIV